MLNGDNASKAESGASSQTSLAGNDAAAGDAAVKGKFVISKSQQVTLSPGAFAAYQAERKAAGEAKLKLIESANQAKIAAMQSKARATEAKESKGAAKAINNTTEPTPSSSTDQADELENIARDKANQRAPVPMRRKQTVSLNQALFLAIVVLPTILVSFYYYLIAENQFMSETRFSVRGVEPSALAEFNLSAIAGSSTYASDAYIVNEYIRSVQLINDLKTRWQFDMRAFYSKSNIDPLYRVDPDIPIEEFISYWNWMSDTDYNSTTQITTFQAKAFSPEDAKQISDAVIRATADLINQLSSDARRQIIQTAQVEVTRTEERLKNARRQITAFRNQEQTVDPAQKASATESLAGGLQKELIDLTLRRTALLSTIDPESPPVRFLDRQISALQDELKRQRRNVGTGSEEGAGSGEESKNLSSVFADYSELILEENFAQNAYTAALASLEAAQADARKQERYFATVVAPTNPNISLFPKRFVIVLTVLGFGFLIWFLAYLLIQSVRDHAV